MLRARWRILALLLPLIGGGAAQAENYHDGWGNPSPVYQGTYHGDEQYQAHGQVFRPERGITCVRAQEICYDEDGFDKRATKRYFGKDAANRAEAAWDRYGYDRSYGRHVFSPRRGVLCDRQVEICVTSAGIDVSRTGKVFGKDARRKARNWVQADQFSPARRVVCDNASRTCFDRRRPDFKLTSFYYGPGNTHDFGRQFGQRH